MMTTQEQQQIAALKAQLAACRRKNRRLREVIAMWAAQSSEAKARLVHAENLAMKALTQEEE